MLSYAPGKNEYYSGGTWEYLYPDGSPGIGLFTSLNHPWGSAPTYVLSEYILGIRPVEPGYKTWIFQPVLGLELGLVWAQGRVPLPGGQTIQARWDAQDGGNTTVLTVTAPHGTNGILSVKGMQVKTINGHQCAGGLGKVTVQGGSETKVVFYI